MRDNIIWFLLDLKMKKKMGRDEGKKWEVMKLMEKKRVKLKLKLLN